MNEDRFWAMIEKAWNSAGGKKADRKKLTEGKLGTEKLFELVDSVDEMIANLDDLLHDLDQDELLEFDRILEKKLYDIDRKEIQAHTDGSDDGFLYARGFIVAIGRVYYDAVNATPSLAVMDGECEDMCYISTHIYEERFGEIPESEISRESASNAAGWAEA